MGANWGEEELWDGTPERPQEMRWFDWALFVACLLIVTAIGVFAAGGPS